MVLLVVKGLYRNNDVTELQCSVLVKKKTQFLHMVDCVGAVFKNMKRRLVVQNLKMA